MLTRHLIRLYSNLVHVLIVLLGVFYAYWCQARFQTDVSLTIAKMGATRGTGTAYRSETHTFTPVLCGVRIIYVYPRCFVEFVLHTFTPVVLWSSYYIRLSPLFCEDRITYA
jgi:hypothetical protein